jgi:hypothetical protein
MAELAEKSNSETDMCLASVHGIQDLGTECLDGKPVNVAVSRFATILGEVPRYSRFRQEIEQHTPQWVRIRNRNTASVSIRYRWQALQRNWDENTRLRFNTEGFIP